MLKRFYDWILSYSTHPYAIWILGIVSFIESSFFPIPPDPLYMAMLMENRSRVWRLAFLCTVTSVAGGILGYYIGQVFFDTIGEEIIRTYHLEKSFENMKEGFQKWGFWLITLKGLTPVPYKIVTITSGVVGLNLATFIIASVIARGFRFYLLAALFWFYGPRIKEFIEKNLGLVSSLALGGLIVGYWIITKL